MEKTKVTVISSGGWGTALAILLAGNGHEVSLWSYTKEEADAINLNRENKPFLPGIVLPASVNATNNCEEAVSGAEFIVSTTPSKFVRGIMQKFAPFLDERHTIINASKGLEEETLLRLSEVIGEVCPKSKLAVLSGPSHAEEVAKWIPTTCVAASSNEDAANRVQSLFMSPVFRVYSSLDMAGVELGGALKNIIALAAGISDGMGYGDNTKAALMTRGIAEISRLGVKMGAQLITFSGLAGIGDLIVTCTSMHSRNRRAGIMLGQGRSLSETLKEVGAVVEGVNTARAAKLMAEKYNVQMPIIFEINKALFEGKDPKQVVNDLMTRDKTTEYGVNL
ncbi:MAG: NAD(P)H-dependent glycerol-3-phosphate dehydrogenase [Clostridiales bacterium]|jgi:glycerol-3-phosphate dehydrogenase (NAD(P)+)|nr:NAD(P)H-dependent glycerol-3-phosphate dehydrogenase [Clostridiales bacterium]